MLKYGDLVFLVCGQNSYDFEYPDKKSLFYNNEDNDNRVLSARNMEYLYHLSIEKKTRSRTFARY